MRRVSTLKPEHVRAAIAARSAAGASVAVVSGRFRVLRSALGWAHVERIIDVNPLSGIRGPNRPGTRLHLSSEEVLPSGRLLNLEREIRLAVAGDRRFLGMITVDDLLMDLAGNLWDLAPPVIAEVLSAHHDSPVPAVS